MPEHEVPATTSEAPHPPGNLPSNPPSSGLGNSTRTSSGGMALVYVMIFYAVQLIVVAGSIAGITAAELFARPPVDESEFATALEAILETSLGNLGWMLAAASLLTIAILYLITRARRQNFRELVAWQSPRGGLADGLSDESKDGFPIGVVGAAILIGLGLSLSVNAAVSLVPLPDFLGEQLAGESRLMTSFGMALVASTLVPIVEELLFRGLIFSTLRERFALPAAIALQAIIFGLAHGNPFQGIYAAILGVAAGFALVRSRSILVPILLHTAANASAFLLAAANLQSTLLKSVLLGAGLSISAAVVALWFRSGGLREQRAAKQQEMNPQRA
jgi:membrane protease YdiL (CAAX protease family)